MTRTALVMSFSLALLLSNAPDADAGRVRGCSEAAQINLGEAKRFLENNMGTLKGAPIYFGKKRKRRRIHRKMDRRLKRIRWTCNPNRCAGDNWLNGNQSGLWRIRLCYENMKSKNASFCDFVGTMAHEYGHAVGLPKAGNHNSRDPSRLQDSTYKFGFWVRDLCKESGLDRELEGTDLKVALFKKLLERSRNR
ncbi:MAG: hypothetical protein KJO07_24110 [Deltaproteobacteria bacterium]|nr:hypothetical protein [Deltaproteobacteria bacterium]